MVERRDVEFAVDDGLVLRGWPFISHGGDKPRAAITMAHGYAGVKERGLEPFAKAFADAGFIVMLPDHRNFGASDGAIRGDVDPWRQIADWRYAISYLECLPDAVDAIWSRVRADDSEVMHLVVHFEIVRLKGKEWRVIGVQSTDNNTKNALNQVFASSIEGFVGRNVVILRASLLIEAVQAA